MTLKSKFLKLYHKFAISDEWEGSLEDDAVKIADDYAIEFAEWLNINYFQIVGTKTWCKTLSMKDKTAKELLYEEFKKEKGL